MTQPETPTWNDGYTRADIQALAAHDSFINLGELQSISPTYNDDEKRFADEMDGLLDVFDIPKNTWQDRIVSAAGTVTDIIGTLGYEQFDLKNTIRKAQNQRLGEFVIKQAWEAVPVEAEDDDEGDFKLTLQLDDSSFATFYCHGDQEIYRTYYDPKTNNILSGEPDELERLCAYGKAISDISEIHSNISYAVQFSNSVPNKV